MDNKQAEKALYSLIPLADCQKSSSMMIFGLGVLLRKTPAKAIETAASMPPKARGMCNE